MECLLLSVAQIPCDLKWKKAEVLGKRSKKMAYPWVCESLQIVYGTVVCV